MKKQLKRRIGIGDLQEKGIDAIRQTAEPLSRQIQARVVPPIVVPDPVVPAFFCLALYHIGDKGVVMEVVVCCLEEAKPDVIALHQIVRQFVIPGVFNQNAHPIAEDLVVCDVGLLDIKQQQAQRLHVFPVVRDPVVLDHRAHCPHHHHPAHVIVGQVVFQSRLSGEHQVVAIAGMGDGVVCHPVFGAVFDVDPVLDMLHAGVGDDIAVCLPQIYPMLAAGDGQLRVPLDRDVGEGVVTGAIEADSGALGHDAQLRQADVAALHQDGRRLAVGVVHFQVFHLHPIGEDGDARF